MENENNNLFQVNLKGMIALLSEHIYSNPNTFVRELLQKLRGCYYRPAQY